MEAKLGEFGEREQIIDRFDERLSRSGSNIVIALASPSKRKRFLPWLADESRSHGVQGKRMNHRDRRASCASFSCLRKRLTSAVTGIIPAVVFSSLLTAVRSCFPHS
jgi:hypothetical protein